MKSFSFFYLNSPYIVKTIMLSVYGFLKNFQRRQGRYFEYLSEAREVRGLDKEKMREVEKERLASAYSSAIKSVKAYSDYPVLPRGSFFSEFSRLPILEKQTLKERGHLFFDPSHQVSEYTTTSGSTGTPLKIPSTREARQKNYAFFDDFLYMHGAERHSKKITIANRQLIKPKVEGVKRFWVYDACNKTLYISAYHLSKSSLKSYIEKINLYKPEYIDSYPSVIYEIAVFAQNHKTNVHSPKFICTSSETLSLKYRQTIESVFRCPVRDQYGSAEMCVFGYECTEGNMHIRTDYSYVEVVDENSNPVPDGTVGDLVCTTFLNKAFPLIRYSIGDRGSLLKDHNCKCKSAFPILLELEGRKDDYIESKSGRKFTRLSPVLKGFPIIESQFEQVTIDDLVLKIVPEKTLSIVQTKDLEAKIDAYLGGEFNINIELVETIPRGSNGKFRAVVNRAKDREFCNESATQRDVAES